MRTIQLAMKVATVPEEGLVRIFAPEVPIRRSINGWERGARVLMGDAFLSAGRPAPVTACYLLCAGVIHDRKISIWSAENIVVSLFRHPIAWYLLFKIQVSIVDGGENDKRSS